jgi:hypothetical protein
MRKMRRPLGKQNLPTRRLPDQWHQNRCQPVTIAAMRHRRPVTTRWHNIKTGRQLPGQYIKMLIMNGVNGHSLPHSSAKN